MGSKPKTWVSAAARRLRRRSQKSNRRIRKPQLCHQRSDDISGGASVSQKLEALRSLIPSGNAETKPDQLFQETAHYIVLLKTQVFVLQKLVDFYGSQPQEDGNVV